MTTKRRFIKHLPLVLAGLALGLGVFVNTNSKSNVVAQETSAADYYSGITATGGTTLLGQLHDLSNEKHTTYNAYNAISTTNCAKTDPYGNTSYVMDFYSGAPTSNEITSSGTVGWNREHVWCQDLSNGLYGKTGAGADIQHLRPTIPSINSDRGNKKYGELNNSGTASTARDANNNTVYGGYYSGDVFQPMNDKKGDAARIIMYIYMHYNKAANVGGSSNDNDYFGTLNFTHVMSANSESAAIQLLLSWNTSDPVDSIEEIRNEEAAKITGCRNPFIDHPEYANMIWGSSSNPSASISPSSSSVAVGSTVSLTATLSNVSNANQISWESDSPSKATVTKDSASTTSSVATVTGVAAGSATINCKYNNVTIGSATVTITSSGGGDSSNEYSLYSGAITEGDYLIVYDNKAMNTTVSSNRLQYETVSVSNNKITTSNSSIIWHIAADGNYWTIYNSAEGKYAAGTGTKSQAAVIANNTDYSKWTVSGNSTYEFVNKGNTADNINANLRENGTYGYACYATGTGGALSLYKKVNSSPATISSIYASVSKTYYVGETISASDITVKDNNENTVSSFTFSNDGYQFKYTDAASGGALTDKTFESAISGSGQTCSLTVQVQRKERVAPSAGSYSVSYSDLPTAYDTSSNVRTASSGLKFIAYNLAHYSNNGKMQFKASGGYLQTTEPLNLSTLTINNRESNTLTVYGSTNGSTFTTTITGNDDVYNLSGYSYVKVARTSSGAAYCTDILITTSGSDTAVSLSNYIMYEDTNNQCNTKLGTAIGYLSGMSSSERSTFSSSNDYVISTARTRLEAWAASKGKTINYSNGSLSPLNTLVSFANKENNNIIIVLVLLSLVGLTAIGAHGYIQIKRNKE